MTLRLTDEETEMLRELAEAEHRSMHEVVRLAIRERAGRRKYDALVLAETRRAIERHREIIDRLRDA